MIKEMSVSVSRLWAASIWLLFWLILGFALVSCDVIRARYGDLLFIFPGIGVIGGYTINVFTFPKGREVFQNVILDNGRLVIGGFTEDIFILARSEIDDIKVRSFLLFRIVEINLKKDTPAGRSIRFIPRRYALPKTDGGDLLEELYRLPNE